MAGESTITMKCSLVHRKPNTVTTIKVRRLEWAGHLAGMSDGRTARKAFLWKLMEKGKQKVVKLYYECGLFDRASSS
jgi:hypothetical protein